MNNVYQINIFQSVQFRHKINKKCSVYLPKTNCCTIPCYPTNFFLINFLVPRTFLKTTRFAISARGPLLWNNCLLKNRKRNLYFFNVQKKDSRKNNRTKYSCYFFLVKRQSPSGLFVSINKRFFENFYWIVSHKV